MSATSDPRLPLPPPFFPSSCEGEAAAAAGSWGLKSAARRGEPRWARAVTRRSGMASRFFSRKGDASDDDDAADGCLCVCACVGRWIGVVLVGV